MELTNKTPDLEQVFPWNWRILKHVNETCFSDISHYRSVMECEKNLREQFREKFGLEYLSQEFYNTNKEDLENYLHDVKKEVSKSMTKIARTFGLSYGSLVKITNSLTRNAFDRNLQEDLHPKKFDDDESSDPDGSALYEYSSIISFIKAYFGSVENISVLEIGSGKQGIRALSYLESIGAKSYALEKRFINPGFIEKSQVTCFNGRWENLSQYFKPEIFDVIYIHHMHPSPHGGGPFNKHESWSSNIGEFENNIAQEMHKVLKPNGLYINKILGLEFINAYYSSKLVGFKRYDLPIESCGKSNKYIDFRLDYDNINRNILRSKNHIKKFPLRNDGIPMYYGYKLSVFQKI